MTAIIAEPSMRYKVKLSQQRGIRTDERLRRTPWVVRAFTLR
jgi:hypothetical protein